MPRYNYRCAQCENTMVINHSMSERAETCLECGATGSLHRVPSLFRAASTSGTNKPGELVKAYIEQTKEAVREEKTTLRKDYDPNDYHNR